VHVGTHRSGPLLSEFERLCRRQLGALRVVGAADAVAGAGVAAGVAPDDAGAEAVATPDDTFGEPPFERVDRPAGPTAASTGAGWWRRTMITTGPGVGGVAGAATPAGAATSGLASSEDRSARVIAPTVPNRPAALNPATRIRLAAAG